MHNTPSSEILDCPVAGSWYPADPETLRQWLDELAPRPLPEKHPDLRGIVSPHAGPVFSGRVALNAYAQVDPARVDRVVVLAPSHSARVSNRVLLSGAAGFRTPLGTVEADDAFARKLGDAAEAELGDAAIAREHGFWIQLPFLQYVLGARFRIVPLIVGDLPPGARDRVAGRLRSLLDDRTLVVASSDFTHYGLRFGYVPFSSNVEEKLRKLDGAVAERILEKDIEGFLAILDKTGATVCGRDPIALWLALLPESMRLVQVDYDTSGHQTGEWENSVSYCSIVALGSWSEAARPDPPEFLEREDRIRLLDLARRTLREVVTAKNAALPDPEAVGIVPSPGMQRKAGGFVTLHKHGALRGCIGEIFPTRPIWRVVRDHTIDAARHDPRFPAVRPEELDAIDIEISALTPPVPVRGPAQIQTGRHGIVLSKQGRQAVFLPQVAVEQGWTLEETLRHLSLKAGLPPDAWRNGAEFLIFEAQVFSEVSEFSESR